MARAAGQRTPEMVSVVIPTRDRWRLLATTLDSVLRQRGVAYEVVVVDDGSAEPADGFKAPLNDPRIRVLRNDRSQGVASARNSGIAAARGDWIAFLDDDDVWAPSKLQAQLEAAGSVTASFAYATALLVREDTGAVIRAEAPPAERLGQLLHAYNAIPAGASNVIVRAALVRSVGGFDPGLFHLADWDLWTRLAAADRGAACPAPLVGYRLHAGSMRSTAGGVLRELRRLDAKHGRPGSAPAGRIWFYRWLADGQLLARRRGATALTYARGGARCRSRSDLLRAVRVLLPLSLPTTGGRGDESALRATSDDLSWLERYLPAASSTLGERPVGSPARGQERRTALELKRAARLWGTCLLERALRLTTLRAGLAFVYHEIGARGRVSAIDLVPVVDASLFREQLAHLGSRYRLVPAGELRKAVLERRRGEPFPVAVTFDDDLRSHFDCALPALREAGAPATFFLTGASLHEPSSFWWERLQRAIDAALPLEMDGDPERVVATVAALPQEEREAFSASLIERLGGEDEGAGLRVHHVRALAAAGFEIGFHTRRHEPLSDLEDRELERALRDGVGELEAAAGGTLRTVAYPHGRADGRVAAAARLAGYESGYTTVGSAVGAESDPLLMGRVYPSRASLAHFASQTALAIGKVGRAPGSDEQGRGRGARRLARGGRKLGRRLAARLSARVPPVGHVRFGDLRRLTPVNRRFGLDRGLPVDRHYVEDFLRRHGGSPGYGGGDIRGRVLEVGGDEYVRRFGGWSGGSSDGGTGVTAVDVLHADRSNPEATIVGDLASGSGVPDNRYDCVICTQTLHVVYDLEGAVRTLHRTLKPGGVALVTVAGITQACRPDRDLWGDYWRFTTLSARRLFEAVFPPDRIRVEAYGNVLAAVAFLHGLAAQELERAELDLRDPDYELLIGVRAQKEGPG